MQYLFDMYTLISFCGEMERNFVHTDAITLTVILVPNQICDYTLAQECMLNTCVHRYCGGTVKVETYAHSLYTVSKFILFERIGSL